MFDRFYVSAAPGLRKVCRLPHMLMCLETRLLLNLTPGPERTERSHVMGGFFWGVSPIECWRKTMWVVAKNRILIGQLFLANDFFEVFWGLFWGWVNTSLTWCDSGGKNRNWVVTIGWALFQKYAMISGWFQEFNLFQHSWPLQLNWIKDSSSYFLRAFQSYDASQLIKVLCF